MKFPQVNLLLSSSFSGLWPLLAFLLPSTPPQSPPLLPSTSSKLAESLTMVDDKYIGLALAISGSLAIGMSFIITKKVCPFSVSFRPGTNQCFSFSFVARSPCNRVSTMLLSATRTALRRQTISRISGIQSGGQGYQLVSPRLRFFGSGRQFSSVLNRTCP